MHQNYIFMHSKLRPAVLQMAAAFNNPRPCVSRSSASNGGTVLLLGASHALVPELASKSNVPRDKAVKAVDTSRAEQYRWPPANVCPELVEGFVSLKRQLLHPAAVPKFFACAKDQQDVQN